MAQELCSHFFFHAKATFSQSPTYCFFQFFFQQKRVYTNRWTISTTTPQSVSHHGLSSTTRTPPLLYRVRMIEWIFRETVKRIRYCFSKTFALTKMIRFNQRKDSTVRSRVLRLYILPWYLQPLPQCVAQRALISSAIYLNFTKALDLPSSSYHNPRMFAIRDRLQRK